jgi:hypothetical protein
MPRRLVIALTAFAFVSPALGQNENGYRRADGAMIEARVLRAAAAPRAAMARLPPRSIARAIVWWCRAMPKAARAS